MWPWDKVSSLAGLPAAYSEGKDTHDGRAIVAFRTLTAVTRQMAYPSARVTSKSRRRDLGEVPGDGIKRVRTMFFDRRHRRLH
jgi:hypothetical protein